MTTATTDAPRAALPPGQARVLDAIRDHWLRHATGPTIRELCAACKISSPNGVVTHLKVLAAKGLIEWHRTPRGAGEPARSRGVWLAGLREEIARAVRELTGGGEGAG